MGRTLLIAEPQLPMNLIVATAHYESLGQSASIRKQQLLESFKLIKAAEKESRKFHSVIVGDFNFDQTWKKEEAVLTENGFKD